MSSPKANHEDRDLIAPGAANDAVVGGETPDRETAGEPEEFAAEILVSDDEAEHLPADPRPDVCLDDVMAEYEAEAEAERERRRIAIEERVLVLERVLRGLTRSEVGEVLERGRALWKHGAAR